MEGRGGATAGSKDEEASLPTYADLECTYLVPRFDPDIELIGKP